MGYAHRYANILTVEKVTCEIKTSEVKASNVLLLKTFLLYEMAKGHN